MRTGLARVLSLTSIVSIVAMLTVAIVVPTAVDAAESVLAFERPADEARYNRLLEEYRCLKCQNQSLADSRASLAQDLRREIYDRVIAGEPKSAIDAYLLARYGDFVLYRPRFNGATAVLWIGPFVLLGIALFAAVRVARRSGQSSPTPTDDSLSEARRLLDDPGKS